MTGFHGGELAVQRQAGVRQDAARLSRMLEPADLSGGIAGFLAARTLLVITGRDATGRLWTSPLAGPAGYLEVRSDTELAVHAGVPAGDPLHGITAGQRLGTTSMDFALRRRVRLNGTLTAATDDLLIVDVEQAYGNCPQYIQQRLLTPPASSQETPEDVRRGAAFEPADVEVIRSADTFFLGTAHPRRGADASHRGGPPGFVRVDERGLWWPDYPGNNMFNSLGNLAVSPETALLFADFTTGATLQLSGTARIEWGEAGRPGDDGHSGRIVRFELDQLVAARRPSLRESAHRPYPHNPALTDREDRSR
ncbi:pyridoxamine 5'-phosphate oxidase family protein [Actinoplanes sp. CA-051413]|uniref:pyridoxamine 5'-phosphate oxidase family protein n=1 Tax=Actinoplanes sp. CA-051413 TaxID=3239899 RepID=UPI003D9614F3